MIAYPHGKRLLLGHPAATAAVPPPPQDRRLYTPEERAHIIARHAENAPYVLIAHELGRTFGSVCGQIVGMRRRGEITHRRPNTSGRRRVAITERPADCAIAPRTFGFDPGLVEFLIEMIGLCLEHASTTCECWREMALQWFANRECRGAGLRVTCVGGV